MAYLFVMHSFGFSRRTNNEHVLAEKTVQCCEESAVQNTNEKY